jgi:hypothetical protein
MTTESANGAHKSGKGTAEAAGSRQGMNSDGVESEAEGIELGGGEEMGRKDGFSLFGTGLKSEEEFQGALAGFLKGEKAQAKRNESGEEDASESEEEHEPPAEEGEESEGEEAESESGSEDESNEESEEKEEEEAEPPKEWPKSAIKAVSGLRKRAREAEALATRTSEEVATLRERLESETLKRPVAPTRENPLSFADSPEKLERWAANTREIVALIEDHLDGSLDPEGESRLTRWAKANGAYDSQSEELDVAELKRAKRAANAALEQHVPARREYFAREKQVQQLVAQDPVLSAVWKDRGSQEYKDALEVLEALPELRRLPSWRLAASIYALGMKVYRDQQESAGTGKEKAAVKGKMKPKAPMKTVKSPGKTVALPRNPGVREAEDHAVLNRVRTPGATEEDFVAYTKRALTGKLAG